MMSARDGVFSRYATDDDGPADLVIIGAPPNMVTLGLPGATGETLAYVERIDRAAMRMDDAFHAWLKEQWEDVLPDDQQAPTEAQFTFIRDWPPWFAGWKVFREKIQPQWDPFGPSPSEVWQETEQHEEELEAFRKRFIDVAKGSKVPPPPPPPAKGYEDPGGLPQPSILDSVTGGLPSLGTVAAILVGGAIILVAVHR